MSNGHSWPNIKTYTLSEIGVFIRSIYLKREEERIENFSLSWMSSNLTQEGMEKVINNMKVMTKAKEKPKTKEEVANEWRRLAAFRQR